MGASNGFPVVVDVHDEHAGADDVFAPPFRDVILQARVRSLIRARTGVEELNLREIGEILGVSESRVCQIHGQALIRLRARMGEWLTD